MSTSSAVFRLCAALAAIAAFAACDNGAPQSTHVRLQLRVSKEGRPHHPVSIEAVVVNDGAFAVNHRTGPPRESAAPAWQGLWIEVFDPQGRPIKSPPCVPGVTDPDTDGGRGFSSFLLPGESIHVSMTFHGGAFCEGFMSEHAARAGTYRAVATFGWSGPRRFGVFEQREARFVWRAE